ncbi:hypothetical protein ACRAWD_22530 [Caulobacter segnis]
MSRHAAVALQALEVEQLSARNFQRLATFIQDYSGIKMPANKRTMLEGRLRRRMRGHADLRRQRVLPLSVRRGRPGRRDDPPDRRGHHQQDRILPRARPLRLPGRQGSAGPGHARQARDQDLELGLPRRAPSPIRSP